MFTCANRWGRCGAFYTDGRCSCDPDGDDRRGLRGVREVSGRVFSRRLDDSLAVAYAHVPAAEGRADGAGHMEIGVSTANLTAILIVICWPS